MYTKIELVKAIKEMMERHWNVHEIASKMHLDPVLIQSIIDQFLT